MNKLALLKSIAETGYNIGFGAKKHFATFDIVDKVPGWISFVSMGVGIYGLVFEQLSGKFLSATILILGISSLYIYFYDTKKTQYDEAGKKLTQLFNKLRDLYRSVQNTNETDLTNYENKLSEIEAEYYDTAISKQIFLSDTYAHYKFFWQHQIDWIEEQKHFKLRRDKIPLTVSIFFLLLLILIILVRNF